jgi:hypothetical protein
VDAPFPLLPARLSVVAGEDIFSLCTNTLHPLMTPCCSHSVINAMAWHRGPKGDHERIAALAGDSSFGYEQVRKAQIDVRH